MANTAVTSSLTPASNTAGKATTVRNFKITDIPAAMDKMKWPVSAALMRHWFQGVPWATEDGAMSASVKRHTRIAPAQHIEESIVKMQWLLSYARAQRAKDDLKLNWNNAAATKVIKQKILNAFNKHTPGCYPLQFNGKASDAEAFGYANTRDVTFDTFGDDIDDLRGALANFNLRVAVEGSVIVSDKKITFIADKLGFYVEDAYDFNDDGMIGQPLGYWNHDGIAPSASHAIMTNAGIDHMQSALALQKMLGDESAGSKHKDLEGNRFFLIMNSHFVKYRNTYNKGGDFRVYSDVLYEAIPPASFEVDKL
jgi:hypothetical protein